MGRPAEKDDSRVYSTNFGHEIYADLIESKPGHKRWGAWKWCDTNKLIKEGDEGKKCTKCNEFRTPDGHDPCIKNLKEVEGACCGHGKHTAYIKFKSDSLLLSKAKMTFDELMELIKKENLRPDNG